MSASTMATSDMPGRGRHSLAAHLTKHYVQLGVIDDGEPQKPRIRDHRHKPIRRPDICHQVLCRLCGSVDDVPVKQISRLRLRFVAQYHLQALGVESGECVVGRGKEAVIEGRATYESQLNGRVLLQKAQERFEATSAARTPMIVASGKSSRVASMDDAPEGIVVVSWSGDCGSVGDAGVVIDDVVT